MQTAPLNTRPTSTDVGLLLIRLILGVVFIYHGSQKLFGVFGGPGFDGFTGFLTSLGAPLPTVSAALAVAAEFFGGIILLLGTGTRLAALPMAFTMLVAIFVHRAGGFSAGNGGFEYPLTLGVVLIALALTGPGRLTIGTLLPSTKRNAAPTPVAA